PKPRAALLIYGVYDMGATLARSGSDPSLEMMLKAYAANGYPALLDDPRLSPLKAIRAGTLPPSFVICGSADTLLPESKNIAEALKRSDIRHEVHLLDEMPHGFLQMGMLSGCDEGLKLMFDFLRRTV
ncbi:MAG: alpha/beta hydrolase, partial [Candidatus Binataceae bacterium]